MPGPFYDRLRSYYDSVAQVLRGESDAASIFPNSSDIGQSRERLFVEFLRLHVPSKCNVFLGGFLFDSEGNESKQLDIIINTDTTPRFDLHNKDGGGKTFSPVEGTLAVVSAKSRLDKHEFWDAMEGFASIPPMRPLAGRVLPMIVINNYEDWPLKVIYAPKGNSPDTLWANLNEFHESHPDVPPSRLPDIVYVAGSCLIVRGRAGMELTDRNTGISSPLEYGTYTMIVERVDRQAISWILGRLQENASASNYILFKYTELINKAS